jgi:quinol monooxygenase YgiN
MDDQNATPAMVMTVLEARIAEEHWTRLKQIYEGGLQQLPAQRVQTYLIQSADDPTLWRVISIWRSREALAEYRRSVEVPGGILIFRSVGAEPTLSIFEVAASIHNRE